MEEDMNKEKMIHEIQTERKRLEQTLEDITKQQMNTPGVIEDWTVKDLLAHITVWEQRMVAWLRQTVHGEVPEMLPSGLTWDDLDQWNEETYQEHRHLDLGQVLADFESSYSEALIAVEEVSEEDLVEPDRFTWREGRPLWKMVAANTSWHYKEHEEGISAWLKEVE